MESGEVANKSKKSSSPAAHDDTNVVRIKAGSSTSGKKPQVSSVDAAPAVADKPVKAKKPRQSGRGIRGLGMFGAIGRYFKGAWVELRQVRWPSRRATWSLTGAVLAYSAFFVVLVLLLDAGFKYLFELILGK